MVSLSLQPVVLGDWLNAWLTVYSVCGPMCSGYVQHLVMLQPMATQNGITFLFMYSFNCHDLTPYMTHDELNTGATVLDHECNWSQCRPLHV